ncbi:MAG: WecB/TagA/CpsF family glycosyltransferase [Candidatus Obscuribacterales bacterium]|nr:WecB/TagA/CpsF family glycosyltransferase [Candidatus Obscuribacterales bacterium]
MSTTPSTYESRHKVLGYPVDVVDETQALERIEKSWVKERGMHVVTLNAEMVVQAQKDAELDRIIRHAHLIVPDGAGAVWALRLDGHECYRVPGIELAYKALSSAGRRSLPVALIGGREEVLAKLLQVLPMQHPGVEVVASHNGFISADDEEAVVSLIAEKEPKLVLVAMGVPRQELFIDKWRGRFSNAVVIGVGGSFDVWAGFTKRAPAFFRKLHLEWFYRLAKEPWRARRILSALPSFAAQVLTARLLGQDSDDDDGGGRSSSGRKSGKWRRRKRNKLSKGQDISSER